MCERLSSMHCGIRRPRRARCLLGLVLVGAAFCVSFSDASERAERAGAPGYASTTHAQAGVLRIGTFAGEASLLDYVDRSGVRHGFASSALREIVDPHGIVLVHRRFASTGAAFAALDAGEIDVVPASCGGSRDEHRWVSGPYALPQAGVVERRERAKPRALADLAGLRVALERDEGGGIAKIWLPPAADLVEVDDARSGVEMVADGAADAFIGIHDANLGIIDAKGYGFLESTQL
jgi:ABC-type amino acid transport substrate-binding protein